MVNTLNKGDVLLNKSENPKNFRRNRYEENYYSYREETDYLV